MQHEEDDDDDGEDWNRATPSSFRDLKDKDFGRGRKSAKRGQILNALFVRKNY